MVLKGIDDDLEEGDLVDKIKSTENVFRNPEENADNSQKRDYYSEFRNNLKEYQDFN
jgi:hypothetical protein